MGWGLRLVLCYERGDLGVLGRVEGRGYRVLCLISVVWFLVSFCIRFVVFFKYSRFCCGFRVSAWVGVMKYSERVIVSSRGVYSSRRYGGVFVSLFLRFFIWFCFTWSFL